MYKKNLFVPAVCSDEKAMTGDKKDTLKQFFDLLTGSKPFGVAYDYLKKNGNIHTLITSTYLTNF
jgi:hypothetical protein